MGLVFNTAAPFRSAMSYLNTGVPSRNRQLLEHDRAARLLRQEMFDGNLINDSSWSIMQDLFAAHFEGRSVLTKELHSEHGLPKATVLRYLDHLERIDIVQRETDPDDTRATLVSLTEQATYFMSAYYARLAVIESKADMASR